MAGRTRRTRFLVLLAFGVVAFVLYTRNAVPVDDYRQYFKEKGIGGGAVIRPAEKPEGNPYKPPANLPPRPPEQPQAPVPKPEPPQVEPDVPEAVKPEPPTPARPVEEETSSTTEAEAEASSSDDGSSDLAPPQHLPAPSSQDEDLPYELGEGRVEMADNPQAIVAHWSQVPEHFPLTSTIQLPTGTAVPLPRIQRAVKKLADAGADKEKLAVIKAATEHAWKGYKEYAFGKDEIRPISGRTNNPFNGWGATLVDSLDTLWIAGMQREFEEAVQQVSKIDFTTSVRPDIPIFETTIRYLGGLIAAYDVSGKKYRILLDKAVELAEVLFTIFDTPNRMPQTYFRWKPSFASQPHRASSRVVLAEIGTLSLEFTRLAQLTKEPKYYDAVARITDAFEEWQNSTRLPGMWPTSLDASGCNRTATRIKEELMLPVGDDGEYMTTKEPVKAGDGAGKLDSDPYDLKQGLENSLEGGVKNRQPGVGKIKGWGNPINEGDVVDKDVKDRLLSEDLGSSKRKREVDDNFQAEKRAPAAVTLDECVPQGLWSTSGMGQETFTLSGASDSMYEYLPKQFLMLGGLVDQYRSMYLYSAETAIQKLVFKPMTIDERDILLTGEMRLTANYTTPGTWIERFKPEAAHLACFAGGMFAMGGVIFNKPEHIEIGSKLTDGCVWAYNVTSTGVMPEGAEVMPCEDAWGKCPWNETAYWDVLDPYWKARTEVPTPVTASVSADDDDDNAVGPQMPKPSLAKRAGVYDETGGVLSALDVVTPEDPTTNDPREPPAPQPPTMPDLPSSPQFSNAAAQEPDPPLPEWTSEPPLSQQQYVAKKIFDERLPPGFTRIPHRAYILRPEAIESVFYMYRITGDPYWREVGWNMFTSIDRHTRAPHGHSAIDDITKAAPEQLDQEESFWLAETLKYFYLLYDEPSRWSLDEWVLNTEAHLFRRPAYEFLE